MQKQRALRFGLVMLVGLAALAGCGRGAQPPQAGGGQPAGVDVAALWEASKDHNSYLMSADDLKKALDAGENIFVLDVRLAEDYAKQGHIPGAVNIPYPEVGKNLDRIPKDRKVAVVCYTGHWAGNTSAWLRVLGYDSYNLRFGMSGWNPETNRLLPKDQTPAYPLVTGDQPGQWSRQQ